MTGEDPTKIRDNIFPGTRVVINMRNNRSKQIQGVVESILTRTQYHSHGIMVQLKDGNIGRVQKIISEKKERDDIISKQDTRQSLNFENNSSLNNIEKIEFGTLVENGENEFVEFKSSSLWSKFYTEEQLKAPTASREIRNFGRDASKVIIAKSIAGFLNTNGGSLIIGIKENKSENADEIIGIEGEFSKLLDQCSDGYRRMIIDEIIRKYFHPEIYNHFSEYIKILFPEYNGKTLCWFQIQKSDVSVFLTIRNKDHFYIRLDAETRLLEGKEMVRYCSKHF